MGDRLANMLRVGTRGCIEIRTKQELETRPEQRTLAIHRHHRNLMAEARSLEDAIVRKRAELEESTLRIEDIRAALAQREAV
eukprot:CAMPEP_0174697458 /NCGR_PEP_ID=MMETSP1094-20130205/3322_1 /TAXON_ID=156173 /ORGANISM="Chrysochromulina brevifilum, Strain UTEX LB 985" /LENGTH=81 /DNA_ID=CAMNT_0015894447 /DNA_START=11 /DNA_END=252 /DNA_ORIENTATION=-